jgi:arginyl-tRNA synthetase
VTRVNHVGDWGTQFGMLVHFLKTTSLSKDIAEDPDKNEAFNSSSIASIASLYRLSKIAFDADSNSFRDNSRAVVVALQSGTDPQSMKIWKAICEKSRVGFQDVYSFLGIKGLMERGESFYNPFLQPLVNALIQGGIATRHDGAVVVHLNNQILSVPKPKDIATDLDALKSIFVIQKADGGHLYATTDLAALWHRVMIDKADMLLYVTDAGQSQHFRAVFEIATQAGWLKYGHSSSGKSIDSTKSNKPAIVVDARLLDGMSQKKLIVENTTTIARHVPFGLVLGANGKKISSRSTDGSKDIRLIDLLQEAVRRSEAEYLRRCQERTASHQPEQASSRGSGVSNSGEPDNEGITALNDDQRAAARIMAVAAVKYADLSMHRESNYAFSYSKMLALNGNTAPYLLYTFVRLNGILSSPNLAEFLDRQHGLAYAEKEEIDLAMHVHRYDEALSMTADELLPSKVRTMMLLVLLVKLLIDCVIKNCC